MTSDQRRTMPGSKGSPRKQIETEAYEPPRVIVIGSVAELTQSSPHGKVVAHADKLCSFTCS